MKIKREVNGQMMEFELNDGELLDAYFEQQHNYDKLHVSDMLDKQVPDAVLSLYATKCRETVEDDCYLQNAIADVWAYAVNELVGPGNQWKEAQLNELHRKVHDYEPWTKDDFELYNYLCGMNAVKEALK